ncbi:MAG: tRNA (adenosine(37)-N6)-threonylcarbamoyltransferase complex transferase subunit TsaD [Deltaproteobacteria bacterium]
MNILGIETSCDETSAAVVNAGTAVRSNAVVSSLKYHKRYGGIVPEIAFRMQLETVAAAADCALSDAQLSLSDIDGISVTRGPGLLGSLLVGVSFAKSLSLCRDIPLVGIDHLYSHIYACFLNRRLPRFPFMALIVSGGHTSIFMIRDFESVSVLGSTRDDAAGEAFDKVAKILGLGYPGGPAIEKAAGEGDPGSIRFGCSNTANPFDFSFSGIKTAVLYHVRKHPAKPGSKASADICASFQHAVLSSLVDKSLSACEAKKIRCLAVGGGVAANGVLRRMFAEKAAERGIELFFPAREFCMDNAAMVAGLGHWLIARGRRDDLLLDAQPTERG